MTHRPPLQGPLARAVTALALCAAVLGPARPALAGPAAVDVSPVAERRGSARLPPHWQHGVFMEIFVRAYQDSDGDGIGDLRGLTQRLPYLKALGISGLWLMPVTASADRDHGYWTTDYRGIERDYGTLADFDALLARARALGIGVIVDYVVNHASAEHPMFVQARRGPGAPYRDWFLWADAEPQGWDIWGKQPWYAVDAQPWTFRGETRDLPRAAPGTRGFYFGTFGPQTPDFDLRHPPAWNYHADSLRFWLNRGVAGFRLDAVPHLVENNAKDWNDQPESRAMARRLQDLVKRYPRRHVVCEATAEPQVWGDPAVCGGAFAFGLQEQFARAAAGQPEAVAAIADYYARHPATMAPFVSNHDSFAGRRLADQVDGDETRQRLAAAAYLLLPGSPYVYYGEEIGLRGTSLPGDPGLRSPMAWTAAVAGPGAGLRASAGFSAGRPFRPVAPNAATHNAQAQQADPASLWHFYRALIGLRHARPSLSRGDYAHARADGAVLSYQRRLGGEGTLVLINFGAQASAAALPGLPPGAALQRLAASAGGAALAARGGAPGADLQRADAAGRLVLRLAPQSVQVFAFRTR